MTKELILNTALSLFAQYGFDSVSVRDIAKQVGIKESSIYYHYVNKQDIFDRIIERFISVSDEMNMQIKDGMRFISQISDDLFIKIGHAFYFDYFMNEQIRLTIKFLMLEQYHNKKASDIFRIWLFEKPQQMQKEYFMKLIEIGYLKKYSAEDMVTAYYAPILFIFLNHVNGAEDIEESKKRLKKHLSFFIEIYKQNGGKL